MTFLRHRNDEDEGFECPHPITCQFPQCDCASPAVKRAIKYFWKRCEEFDRDAPPHEDKK